MAQEVRVASNSVSFTGCLTMLPEQLKGLSTSVDLAVLGCGSVVCSTGAHAAAVRTLLKYASGAAAASAAESVTRCRSASSHRAAQFSTGSRQSRQDAARRPVVKDAVRSAGADHDSSINFACIGNHARFVISLAKPFTGILGVRRCGRYVERPACQGVRAAIWIRRWSGRPSS